ncbi:MAG: hypothetical protein E5V75_29245 [Mesorhizobium sp.]|nr:MAG: hypothetical protein E5V75_29245 [Mesorhizobium sp.]
MKSFQISVFDDHEALSEKAAKWLVKHVGRAIAARGYCVFVPSAGRTPTKLYEILRTRHRQSIDWSRVITVQMDEYAGMPSTSPESFAHYIINHLTAPLGVKLFHRFFDEGGNLAAPFAAIDQRIYDLGGIDIVLYGVGENGHLGLNEPGATEDSETGYVYLTDATLISNTGRPLKEARTILPTEGATLGLKVLLRARKSLLIASGARKREAVSRFMMDGISAESPSTFLRLRESVTVMITSDCAPYSNVSRQDRNQFGACSMRERHAAYLRNLIL